MDSDGEDLIQMDAEVDDESKFKSPRRTRAPRCVILAPTRELAKQVEREFAATAPTLRLLCVYGGVSIQGHERDLRRGTDVVVGTPGRVIDLMKRGVLDMSEVEFAILDEADQMLNVGFEEDVETIMAEMPKERKNYLFSATMPHWVKKLSRNYMEDPVTVDLIGDDRIKIADTITIMTICVPPSVRRSVLVDLITVHGTGRRVICFTQTKREADEVATALAKTHAAEALHGDIAQWQREKTLAGFRDGRFGVLVATDVAARGLDIPNVDLVVHYEMPQDSETFLHRSGRTGRANKSGTAILMHTERDYGTVGQLERAAGITFTSSAAPSAEKVLQASAESASKQLDSVQSDLLPYFLETAKDLVKSQDKSPEEILAAALAAMSGLRELPPPRSLLTYEEGIRTILMQHSGDDDMRSGRFETPRDVMQVLGQLVDRDQKLGKIKIAKNGDAVVDLPEAAAKEMRGFYEDGVGRAPMEAEKVVEGLVEVQGLAGARVEADTVAVAVVAGVVVAGAILSLADLGVENVDTPLAENVDIPLVVEDVDTPLVVENVDTPLVAKWFLINVPLMWLVLTVIIILVTSIN
eukprot:gene15531-18408_t